MEQMDSNPLFMKPKTFAMATSDMERIARIQSGLSGSMGGRLSKSLLVRAALSHFESLPKAQQLDTLNSSAKEMA